MNYDPLETCPYDPVHRIMRSRMQCHLVKCRKNWPCSNKKQCPYDARHIINEIEFNYHVSTCPQRESVLRYKFVENTDIPQPKILPIDSTPAAPSEENWEDDVKVKSYDPMKNTQNRPVIRPLEGAQKAQRKLHKQKERFRHSQLKETTVTEQPSAAKSKSNLRAPGFVQATIPEETSAETEQEYKPLRRPKKLPLDTSRVSDCSAINDSIAGIETQNSIDQNKSLDRSVQEKSNGKENGNMQQKDMHSYASALKQQNISIESDYDVVIEDVQFDADKTNSSFFNSSIDENLVKVSKTVEQLTIGDEGHKIQSASLDKTLESLKKTDKNYPELKGVNNGSNNSNNIFPKERRSLRCAANFSNAKCTN